MNCSVPAFTVQSCKNGSSATIKEALQLHLVNLPYHPCHSYAYDMEMCHLLL